MDGGTADLDDPEPVGRDERRDSGQAAHDGLERTGRNLSARSLALLGDDAEPAPVDQAPADPVEADTGVRTETAIGTFDGARPTPDPERQAWPKEGGKYLRRDDVFTMFCNMPTPRSVTALHTDLASRFQAWQRPTIDTIRRWAKQHNWWRRLEAYDQEIQREARQVNQTLRAEENADLAHEARATAYDVMQAIQRAFGSNAIPIENVGQAGTAARAAVVLMQYADAKDGGISPTAEPNEDGRLTPDEALHQIGSEIRKALGHIQRGSLPSPIIDVEPGEKT